MASETELTALFEEISSFEENQVVAARKLFFKLHKEVEGKPPLMKVLSDLQVPELVARAAELLAKAGVEVDGAPAAPADEPPEEEVVEEAAKDDKPKATKTSKPKAQKAAAASVEAVVNVQEIADEVYKKIGGDLSALIKGQKDIAKGLKDLSTALDEIAKSTAAGAPDSVDELAKKFDSFRDGLSNALGAAAMEILGD